MTEQELQKQQIITWLGDIITRESEKADKDTDYALMNKSADLLYQITEAELCISSETLQKAINEIQNTERKHRTAKPKHRRMPRFLAAALISVFLFVFAVGAVCIIDESVREGLLYVLGLEPGTTVELDGVIYYYGGQSRTYATVDDLLQKEQLDLLYPHTLPDGVVLSMLCIEENATFPIMMFFNDLEYSITVYEKDSSEIQWGMDEHTEKHTINGRTVSMQEKSDIWIALLYDESYREPLKKQIPDIKFTVQSTKSAKTSV